MAALSLAPCVLLFFTLPDARVKASILVSTLVSILGFLVTKRVVPVLKASLVRAGLSGLDINKKGTEAGEKRVPESMGLASGVVFLVSVMLCLPVLGRRCTCYDCSCMAAGPDGAG